MKYSAYDRELLAAYSAIQYFRHMLEARKFILYVDHKPLIYALQQKQDKCSPRRLRQLDFIAQFTTDIRYLPGRDNIVADCFSRINEIEFFSPSQYQLWHEEQSKDDELKSILEGKIKFGVPLTEIKIANTNISLLGDTSGPVKRYYVPHILRKKFLIASMTSHTQA